METDKIMALVVYEHPIDHLSGKIAKKYQVIYMYRKESKRKFTSVHGERTTSTSNAELAAQERFAAIARAVAQRSQNLTQKAQDLVAFKEQRDEPGGKKTLKSYLWSLEIANWEQQHP